MCFETLERFLNIEDLAFEKALNKDGDFDNDGKTYSLGGLERTNIIVHKAPPLQRMPSASSALCC